MVLNDISRYDICDVGFGVSCSIQLFSHTVHTALCSLSTSKFVVSDYRRIGQRHCVEMVLKSEIEEEEVVTRIDLKMKTSYQRRWSFVAKNSCRQLWSVWCGHQRFSQYSNLTSDYVCTMWNKWHTENENDGFARDGENDNDFVVYFVKHFKPSITDPILPFRPFRRESIYYIWVVPLTPFIQSFHFLRWWFSGWISYHQFAMAKFCQQSIVEYDVECLLSTWCDVMWKWTSYHRAAPVSVL